MRRGEWSRTTVAGVLAGLVGGLACAFWAGCTPRRAEGPVRFDAAAWREAAPPDAEPRAGMVRDLLARHALVGMGRDEVEALLGPPDSERWSDSFPFPAWDCGEYGFDFHHLLIVERGPDGRVARVDSR